MTMVEHILGGVSRWFAQPITFTPYAAPTACPARCVFCSETLVERGSRRSAAAERPGPDYSVGLRRSLQALRGLSMGLSLSGLEATSDPEWLCGVLAVLTEHEALGNRFQGKVLYSNGFGFAIAGTQLVGALGAFGLDRLELSRHAVDDVANGALMRFRRGVAVAERRTFEEVVERVREDFHVRLVCVPQRGGVDGEESLVAYLQWARELGVREVVFRELAHPGERYVSGPTWRYQAAARVPVGALAERLLGASGRSFRQVDEHVGYYYRTAVLEAEDGRRVTFESSSYAAMHARHQSGVVHKLVHHTGGNLCGGWNPDRHVLLRGAEPLPNRAPAELGAVSSAVFPLRARDRGKRRLSAVPSGLAVVVPRRALEGDPVRPGLRMALTTLRDLDARGVPTVLIGTAALALMAPQWLTRAPADCDVLVSEELLEPLVRGLSSFGYRVASWGDPVVLPLDPGRLGGRFYLRALAAGRGVPIDATYEGPLSHAQALSRASRREGLWVAASADVLQLKALRGSPRDRAVLDRAGWPVPNVERWA